MERYKLACLAIPLVFAVLFWFSRGESNGIYLANLPVLTLGIVLLIALPLLLEALAAFLFNRQYVRPRVMLRAFGEAVSEWFNYNRHGAVGPATFQSPVGGYRARRRMSLALMALFAAWIAPQFSMLRDSTDRLDTLHRDSSGTKSSLRNPDVQRTGQPQFPVPSTRDAAVAPWHPAPGVHFASSQPGALVQAGSFPPRERPFHRFAPEAQPSTKTEGLELEPYQKAMLDRMSPEKRAEYLDRLRNDQAAHPMKPPASDRTQDRSLREGEKRHALRVLLAAAVSSIVPVTHLIYAVVCMALVPLFLLACCFTTAARVVGFYGQQLGTGDPVKLLRCETWDDLVRRLRRPDREG